MKISALEVDGFGVWSGLKLEKLDDGLTVFYGPNEAGKTTLMQYVRAVFYGFSPERRRYMPPVRGGRPGGSVWVDGPQGQFRITRHASGEGRELVEQLALAGADGTRHGEHFLKVLLSGVDETIYTNVFAVGLRELQELGTLGDTEAAALMYDLSVGLDRVSLSGVMRHLNGSRNRLLDADGGPCELTDLWAQREQLRAEIEEHASLAQRYGQLASEREQADRDAKRLEEEAEGLDHQIRVVRIAMAVGDRWRRRAALDDQLAVLAPADSLPEGALERLDEANVLVGKHESRLAELKRIRGQIRAEAAELKVNENLWRLAPRIEALAEQADWLETLDRRVGELETEITDLEAHTSTQRERLGIGTTGGGRVPHVLSPASLSALRQPARAMRQARESLQQAQQEVESHRQGAAAKAEQIETALLARNEENLAEAMDRAGGTVAQLRRRVQMDERIDKMQRYRADLEEQSREHLDHQLLPLWVLLALGAGFVLGVTLLLAGLFMPGSIIGSLGWPLAILGVAGCAAAVLTKMLLERSSARRLDGCQQQLAMLQTQVEQARKERDEFDRELPRGGGPIVTRLQAAERELEELEELVPLDAQRRASEEEAAAALERVARAETALRETRRLWQHSLAALGLPPKLTPRQVKGLIQGSDNIADLGHRLELRYEEFQQRTKELESVSGRIRKLATEMGLVDLQERKPAELLAALVEKVRQEESRVARRDQLRKKWHKLRRVRSKHDKALARLKRRRRELLRRAGVEDEGEFRRRAAELARTLELRRQRNSLSREIEATIAGQCSEDEVRRELEAEHAGGLEAQRSGLQSRLEAVRSQLGSRHEARGRLAEQLRMLADDRRPAEKRLELATVERRLETSVRRWQTLAATSRILASIRESYERDRQPETLREASGYLERFTQGRYGRVWTPLDENVLLVDDAAGKSLPVEVLSQGAREQLFLSLRLALAGCYARRGSPMPLVLDDVLVNFDSQRAKAAAEVLRDFAAAGNQLLVFTCHEHIQKLFRSLKVDVTVLPDNAELEAPIAVAPKPSKRRRPAPKPEPEPEPVVAEEEPVEEQPPEPEEVEAVLDPPEDFIPWDGEEAEVEDWPLEDVEEDEPAEEEEEEDELDDEYEEDEFEDDEEEEDEYEEEEYADDEEDEYEDEEPYDEEDIEEYEEEDEAEEEIGEAWDEHYEDDYGRNEAA